MMEAFYNPWTVCLLFAYFIWYAPLAWLAAGYRLVRRRMSRKELVLLGLFVLLVALEVFQLKAEAFSEAFAAREVWGLPRYFNAFGPLLWIWLAWLMVRVVVHPVRAWRLAGRAAVAVFILVVGLNESVRYLVYQCTRSDAMDAWVAARRVAAVIRQDYAGPRRHENLPREVGEYYTDRRPVVFGNFGAAAWAVGGQSEGATLGVYPNPPDYVFLNLDRNGYRGWNRLNPDEFERIFDTPGRTCRWVLYRRKGTPHR